MLAIIAERHRALTIQPGGELLVSFDNAVGADARDDRAKLVEHIVRAIRVRRDLRIQANQRLTEMMFDQDLVSLPRKVLPGEKMPSAA